MAKHWIFGCGQPGCLFDYSSGPYDTQDEAAEEAGHLYDLSDAEVEALRDDGIVFPEGEDWNGDLVEVMGCSCESPKQHQD
ncbi:MAG: hypothetical protein WC565_08030 [Parcubacteria group bacterium]